MQFIREASDSAIDETSNRRRRQTWGDEDELMAEQEERRRRQKLNKEFKQFAEKIKEVVRLQHSRLVIIHAFVGLVW